MATECRRVELTTTPKVIGFSRGLSADTYYELALGEAYVLISSDTTLVVGPDLYTTHLKTPGDGRTTEQNHTGQISARAVSGTAVIMITEAN